MHPDWMPTSLRGFGPMGLAAWQWIALPLALFVAVALGRTLGHLTRRLLCHLAKRTGTHLDDALVKRLAGPITWLWALALWWGALATLRLPAPALARLADVTRLGFFA